MNIYLAGTTSAPALGETWATAIEAAGHTALRPNAVVSNFIRSGWTELQQAHHVVVLVGDGYPATAMERLELATLWCLALREHPSLPALSWVHAGETPHAGPWTTHPDRVATDPTAYLSALTEPKLPLAERVERARGLDRWVVDDLRDSPGEAHPATDLATIAFRGLMGVSEPVRALEAILPRLEATEPATALTLDCVVALTGAYRVAMRPELASALLQRWERSSPDAANSPDFCFLFAVDLMERARFADAVQWLERSRSNWAALRADHPEAMQVRDTLVDALVGARRFVDGAKEAEAIAALLEGLPGAAADQLGLVRAKAMMLRALGGDPAWIKRGLDLAATFRMPFQRTEIQRLAVRARLAHPDPAELNALIKRAHDESWGSLLVLELQTAQALDEAGDGENLGALRRLMGYAQQLKKVNNDHPQLKTALALLKRFPHIKPPAKAKAPTLKQITDHPAIEMRFQPTEEASIPLGASKAAGHPDLPADIAWPVTAAGPAVFMLQVRLSDVPPFPGREQLPAKGMLWFFLGETARGNPVDLLRFGAEEGTLVRTPPPAAPVCSWSDPSAWRPCTVSFAPWTLRSATAWRLTRVMAGMTQELLDKLEDEDKLDKWASDVPVDGRSWLGGVPCVSQARDPFASVADDAVFLAQLGYSEDTGWMHGDGGQHTWFMHKAPLENGVIEGAGVVADGS